MRSALWGVNRLMTKPQERLDTKTWGEDSTHAVPHQWKLESVLSRPPLGGDNSSPASLLLACKLNPLL